MHPASALLAGAGIGFFARRGRSFMERPLRRFSGELRLFSGKYWNVLPPRNTKKTWGTRKTVNPSARIKAPRIPMPGWSPCCLAEHCCAQRSRFAIHARYRRLESQLVCTCTLLIDRSPAGRTSRSSVVVTGLRPRWLRSKTGASAGRCTRRRRVAVSSPP